MRNARTRGEPENRSAPWAARRAGGDGCVGAGLRFAGEGAWVLVASMAMMTASSAAGANGGLTAVPGIRVGHHTLDQRPTGCTVILAAGGAVGSVEVRGAAPATRETDLLDPVNTVDRVHAVVLAGGSAFGLDAASGVMRYLEERGVGYDTGVAKVPIVPAAALFDLAVGDARVRPAARCGYEAARGASTEAPAEGSVGAGAGATVGKLLGPARAMKAGIGSAALRVDELVVAALVAVNAAGDIVDPHTDRVIAGVRSASGDAPIDVRSILRKGGVDGAWQRQNTTIGVVATNAKLSKTQAKRVAQVAHGGLARTIVPAHTPFDGDALFVLATGDVQADLLTVGALAAEAVATAVVRAAREATGLPGLPAWRDLQEADHAN